MKGGGIPTPLPPPLPQVRHLTKRFQRRPSLVSALVWALPLAVFSTFEAAVEKWPAKASSFLRASPLPQAQVMVAWLELLATLLVAMFVVKAKAW